MGLVGRLRAAHPTSPRSASAPPGLVDRDGAVHYAPNIPRLIRVPLQAILARASTGRWSSTTTPTSRRAGELHHGAARGVAHGLVITLGTGVGGGIISDGRHRARRARLRSRGRPLAVRPARAALRVRRAGPLGVSRLRHRARAARASPGARRRRAQRPCPGGRRRGRRDQRPRRRVPRRPATPTGAASSPRTRTRSRSASPVSPTSWIPSSSSCPAGWWSSATCSSRPLREAFRAHLEGAPYRPAVPIVAAELGERAGVVGAAALAREVAG